MGIIYLGQLTASTSGLFQTHGALFGGLLSIGDASKLGTIRFAEKDTKLSQPHNDNLKVVFHVHGVCYL